MISYIQQELTDETREEWVKSRMSHSQLFALKEEKTKKVKTVEEIVPKEFHEFLPTVFSEREPGKLPPRSAYDHKIDLKPNFIPKRGNIY